MINLAKKSIEYQRGFVGMLIMGLEDKLMDRGDVEREERTLLMEALYAFRQERYCDAWHWAMELLELLYPEGLRYSRGYDDDDSQDSG